MKSMKYFHKVQRFDAFDGKLLQVQEEPLSEEARKSIASSKRVRRHDFGTVGALGCYKSHIGALQTFLSTDENYCIVLEDDVWVTDKMISNLSCLSIPEDMDYLVLQKFGVDRTGSFVDNVQEVHSFTGTFAYCVSRRGAEKIVKAAFPFDEQIDGFLSGLISKGLKVYWAPSVKIGHRLQYSWIPYSGSTIEHYKTFTVAEWTKLALACLIGFMLLYYVCKKLYTLAGN